MPSTESWILEGRQSNELYSMVHPIQYIYLSIILFCSIRTHLSIQPFKSHKCQSVVNYILKPQFSVLYITNVLSPGQVWERNCPHQNNFNYILLILRIKLLRNSLRNHPEIPNYTKKQNSEQKEIRIHNERSQQQKSNDNSKNCLVNCVFIFAYDNNCLYWIENKLFLFIYFIYLPFVVLGSLTFLSTGDQHYIPQKLLLIS